MIGADKVQERRNTVLASRYQVEADLRTVEQQAVALREQLALHNGALADLDYWVGAVAEDEAVEPDTDEGD